MMRFGIGADISQVESSLKTLTSKVTSTLEQFKGLQNIKTHINSKDFEVGLERMKRAYDSFTEKFKDGISIKYGSGKTAGSFNYESLFGSRNQMEKSNATIKKILAGEVSTRKENIPVLREIAQYQELYLKGVNAATSAVDKQKVAILRSVEAEQKLVAKQKQRVDALNAQINANPMKSVKDIERALKLSQQVSAEMRKWGTNAGNIRAAQNDKRTADLQKKLELAKKNAQEEKRVLDLAQKQEDLLRRQNEADQRSIAGLTERFNISKKILDIQRQLVGTAFHDKNLIVSQQSMQDPRFAAFSRKYAQHIGALATATSNQDLTAQLKELNAMRQMLLSRQVQTGQSFVETAEIEKKIAKTKELIAEEKRRAAEKKKEENALKSLAAKQAEINELEKRRGAAKSINNKLASLREENKVVGQLINKWTSYLATATKANDSAAISKAQQKLAILNQEKAKLVELLQVERNRIRAINQQKSLLNEQQSIFARLKTLATTYFSIYQLFNFIKQIFNATKELERQQVSLEGIVGSATKATDTFNKLKNMAVESPFSLMNLTGFTKQLSAYGIAVDELLPTTHKLAELSAGLGVDMSRLILAYGQVNAAAVLRGQELRQFTEAGVPLVDKLADKFTELNGRLVTTGEVFELISKRQVSFEMVSDILTDMTSEGGKFYKMQENLMDTLYGQLEKVKDLWQIGLKEVGDSTNGIFMRTIIRIQKLIKNLPSLVKTLGFALAIKMGYDLLRTIRSWGPAASHFFAVMRRLDTAGKKVAFTFRSISKALTGNLVIAALSAIFYAIHSIVSKNREWKNTIEEINTSFAKDTAKYINGLDKLLGVLSSTVEGTKEYNRALETLKSNYSEYIDDSTIQQLIRERQELNANSDAWMSIYESITMAIQAKKEWERLNANKDTAVEKLQSSYNKRVFDGKIINKRNQYVNYVIDGSGEAEENRKQYQKYEAIRLELIEKDIHSAISSAIAAFGNAGETSLEEFTERLELALQLRGLSRDAKQHVIDNSDVIYQDLNRSKYWDTYINSLNQLEDNFFEVAKDAFATAQRNIATNKEHKWVDGMKDEDYNPFKNEAFADLQFANAAKELVGQITTEIKRNETIGENGVITNSYLQDIEMYNKTLGKVNESFANLSLDTFLNDSGKTREIVEYLIALLDSIDNSLLRSHLKAVIDQFKELAGTKSGVAKEISTKIQQNYGAGSTASKEEKEFMLRYAPTDENYSDLEKRLIGEKEEAIKYIETHGTTSSNPAIQQEINRMQEKLKWITTLSGEEYYDIEDKEKNSGSTPAESIPVPLSEFLEKLKNAYERYKEASQKGGINAALGYVRTDEQFTEMFGEFFGGTQSKLFKSLENLKVGDKTAMSLLQDKFIHGGIEDGILDFESAIKDVAKALNDYATDANGNIIETRKVYATAARQLYQYIQKTFAKDNLAIVLEEFEQGLKSVTNTFDQTTKAVEAYKKTIQQGTSNKFGNILGISKNQAYTPKSTMQESLVKQLVGKYNTLSGSFQGETIDVEGRLSTPSDIYSLITELENVVKMNNKNFGADVMGKPGQSVIAELKKLADTITEEIVNISGKSITGNSFQNAVANAAISTKASMSSLKEVQATSLKYGIVDAATIEALLKSNKEQSQSFFDAFMNSNQSTMMEQLFSGGIDKKKFEEDFDKAVEELEKKFQKEGLEVPATLKFELELRKEDLKDKIDKFNAEGGKIGLGDEIRKYRNAPTENKELYDRLKQNVQTVTLEKISAESEYDELKPLVESGEANDAQVARFEELTTLIPILNGQLAQYNAELDRIGENGSLETQRDRVEALANMQTKLNYFSQGMTQMQDAVIAIVDSIKSAMNTFSKFYDILHDGENPKWMEIMDQTMSDFIENFKTAVAPVLAVVAAIVAVIVVVYTLTAACAALQIAAWPLLVIMAALIAIAAIVAAVMTAIQAHDNNLQASIEELEKEIEAFDRAAKQLNSTAERMVGLDKMKAQADALGKSMSKATAAAEQARLEAEKKNTDEDKLQEYKDAAFEYEEEFKNGLKDMLDELVGAVEDWSDAMSDAIRSAFQNGENAARSFRATVKEMIGDVVQKMLDIAILEPIIKGAIQDWTDQEDLSKKYTYETEKVDENGNTITETEFDEEGYLEELLANIKDPKKAKKFYAQMLSAGDAVIEAIENLPPELKDAYAFNAETSALSGGISGITEDTARQLEAIGNSQLIQLIQIKQLLETYAGGGLDKTHMAYVQTHLTLINNNVANIVKAINELRTTRVNPLHVTVI